MVTADFNTLGRLAFATNYQPCIPTDDADFCTLATTLFCDQVSPSALACFHGLYFEAFSAGSRGPDPGFRFIRNQALGPTRTSFQEDCGRVATRAHSSQLSWIHQIPSTGTVRTKRQVVDAEAELSSDLLIYLVLTRRGLALDQARLLSDPLHSQWVNKFFDRHPGFSARSFQSRSPWINFVLLTKLWGCAWLSLPRQESESNG